MYVHMYMFIYYLLFTQEYFAYIMYVHHICGQFLQTYEEVIRTPEMRGAHSCEPPYTCLELNPDPLKE